MFRTLFRAKSKRLPEERLPQLHAFVDVTVGGRAMRSVSVEEIDSKEFVVGDVVGRAGETGVFVYTTPAGRFRFTTKVLEIRQGTTAFAMPQKIEALGGGASQKRSSVRMDTLVAGHWRFAPGGKGVGEYQKGSIRDISRGGCSLIADRHFKLSQMLEVRMTLRQEAAPLAVLGEVMRSEQIPTSGKFSHGLRFHGLTAEEDQSIRDFIHRKQTDLRNRGLA